MRRSTDRILTSHSGSLPRPPELIRLLTERSEGRAVDATTFEPLVSRAIAEVVARQVAAGVTVVNDGENSKISYAGYLKDRLHGFEELEEGELSKRLPLEAEAQEFPEFFARTDMRHVARRACCVGAVKWKAFDEVERDIANLKAATQGAPIADAFMSAASPTVASSFQPNRFYPSLEAYRYAMADVLKREYQAIIDAGFVLQVDFPDGVRTRNFGSEGLREVRSGLAANIEVLNYALAGLPEDQVRIHMCWGSDEGPHNHDVELPQIVDLLMKIKAAGITLVGANGRHEHEWRTWEDFRLPEGKVIIIGVIDSTTNIIEHPRTVADRIVRYANVIGRENVIAGVDCGFSTIAGTEKYRVDPKIAWAKLRSLSDGAELASRQLWK